MKVLMRNLLMLATGMVMLLPIGCSSQDEPADSSEVKNTKSSSDDDDDAIWDIAPVLVYADVIDAAGNNLLDPAVNGNIVGETLTIEYKGEAYGVQWDTPWPGYTRAYLARFFGMLHHPADRYKPASAQNPWILEIGEWPGDDDYDITFPLKYKDKEFDIRVVNSFKWVNHRPNRTTQVYLNGKKCDNQHISIVL